MKINFVRVNLNGKIPVQLFQYQKAMSEKCATTSLTRQSIIGRLVTWKNMMHLSNSIKRQSSTNKVIRLWPVRKDFLLRLPIKIRFKEKAEYVISVPDITAITDEFRNIEIQ